MDFARRRHLAWIVATQCGVSPGQYSMVQECLEANNGGTTLIVRRKLAAAAFALSASYDSMIATFFQSQLVGESPVVTRVYQPAYPLNSSTGAIRKSIRRRH
jgi:AICAR transformylase/IMP cyclohydrolase PurH